VLEEVTIKAAAPLCGQALGDGTDAENELGVHLLGIMTREGRMLMRDIENRVLAEGDTLILLGDPDSMKTAIVRITGKASESVGQNSQSLV